MVETTFQLQMNNRLPIAVAKPNSWQVSVAVKNLKLVFHDKHYFTENIKD